MSDQAEGEQDKDGIDPGAPSAVDEEQRKRRETRKQRQSREDREFFRMVMDSAAGRRLLWGILQEAHTFDERFSFGPVGFPDPHETFFKLGEKMLGQRLYQSWHIKEPANVMLMLSENDARFQQVAV